jgi:hypothetical protein
MTTATVTAFQGHSVISTNHLTQSTKKNYSVELLKRPSQHSIATSLFGLFEDYNVELGQIQCFHIPLGFRNK